MEKLSDYIPLIIILGSFIISILQASKKKKGQKDMGQKDMGKTMLPKGVYRESKPEVKPFDDYFPEQPQVEQPNKKKKIRPQYQSVDNPEVKRAVVTIPNEIQSLAMNEDEEQKNFALDTTNLDELKRAVVYSEILHRKEF